ncbi:MAG: VIT1/CCC1 family protein [candidate division WOR-3 bacterium]
MSLGISPQVLNLLLEAQRKEITEYYVYLYLAEKIKGEESEKIRAIGEDEFKHYEKIKEITNREIKPSFFKIFLYKTIIKIFGIVFGLKLMEKGEELSEKTYDILEKHFEDFKDIRKEEKEHEMRLISFIKEERLKYLGSMVLGTSDALVELTGALAGLTFALRNSLLIVVAGFITGFSAALSMAGSEYLSVKAERIGDRNPLKSAVYTGFMYIAVVLILLLPYLILKNPFISLFFSLVFSFIIISLFTFYISVVYDEDYKERFFEMFLIILVVSFLSFLIGFLLREVLFGNLSNID